MSPGAVVRLRCPDCGARAGSLVDTVTCPGCGRRFHSAGGVWDLLPSALAATAANEDRLHEAPGLPTWRRLFFHKRYWLEWCDQRWLPGLLARPPRTFLELGGGLCYASALAKARCPDALVVASDVSPRYLRTHAVPTGRLLETPADAYAAVDAAVLPFEDGQFDAIYSQVVLYRLPDPGRALREIRRVLAPGGRYLGIERASPWLPPFREDGEMRRRAELCGVDEKPIRYREWVRLLGSAGLDGRAIAPVPGRRVRSRALRRLGNAVRQIYVTISIDR